MSEQNASGRKLISIICCVYNEEKCLPIFYPEIQKALAPLNDRYDLEFLFVNNRSTDRTLEIIRGFHEKDPRVKVLTMSRNFGYQSSVQAGFTHASGDASVVIDADLEDPPEMILEFVAKWEEGYDVIYGARENRAGSRIGKTFRNLYYHLLQVTADTDIVLYMAEFALVSKTVRAAILNNQNTFPFLRTEIGYVGFSRYGINYTRHPRAAGRSNYNFFTMITFGAAGLLTSSTFLLRLATYLFPVLAVYNAVMLWLALTSGRAGYFQGLVAADLLYITFLLTVLGVYIARIYKNGIGRPLFVLDPKHTYPSKLAAIRQT